MNERILRTRVAAVGTRAAKVVDRAADGGAWTVEHLLRAAEWLKTGDKAAGLQRAWPALAARLKTIASEAATGPVTKKKAKAAPTAEVPAAEVATDPALDVPETAEDPVGSAYTMAALAEDYLRHLEAAGKSRGTVFSYSLDLGIGLKHFGADRDVRLLSVADVEAFNASDTVLKTRSGAPKADVSIAKTRRVLRLALEWAASDNRIAKAPLPQRPERRVHSPLVASAK